MIPDDSDRLVGYRVDSSDGRIGVVVALDMGGGETDAAALIVRSGLFQASTTWIPVERVSAVMPDARRIVVAPEVAL